MNPDDALLAATALHTGFQAVVTVVVYPALAQVPAARWDHAYAAHSRRVTWVVAPVYALTVAACLWVLIEGPHSALLLTTIAGNACAALLTAVVAAPTHARLGRQGPVPHLLVRLLRADRLRLVSTLVALAAVLVAQ